MPKFIDHHPKMDVSRMPPEAVQKERGNTCSQLYNKTGLRLLLKPKRRLTYGILYHS